MPTPPPSGASVLDGMPPSPASIGDNPGTSPEPTLDALGRGTPLQIGAADLPPEVLEGVMGVGQNVSKELDSLAQITPDLGADWQAIKQLLLATLAKLVSRGAPPAGPTDPGTAFPGVTGGLDRGRAF